MRNFRMPKMFLKNFPAACYIYGQSSCIILPIILQDVAHRMFSTIEKVESWPISQHSCSLSWGSLEDSMWTEGVNQEDNPNKLHCSLGHLFPDEALVSRPLMRHFESVCVACLHSTDSSREFLSLPSVPSLSCPGCCILCVCVCTCV